MKAISYKKFFQLIHLFVTSEETSYLQQLCMLLCCCYALVCKL